MRSVIIVGAGPAGLSAARHLTEAGLRDVLVLDRDQEAGGLPRCCGHLGWGMTDQYRILTGPAYAKRLAAAARGAEIRTDVTVTALFPDGRLQVSSVSGMETLSARTILLATGIRETPRSARLVSGTRPWGVITTGTFQDIVYRGRYLPFRRPVIIGSELVSFSALLAARHAGIRPVAMLEQGKEIVARWPVGALGRFLFGVPIMLGTRIVEIRGNERVESIVVVQHEDNVEKIFCDSVIFSGQFTPEASLIRASHLLFDPRSGGPIIDNQWRCSDRTYFAAGNVLRAVEHSGMAAWEGRQAARAVLHCLKDGANATDETIHVGATGALRYVYPQRIVPGTGAVTLFARVSTRCNGMLHVKADGISVMRRRLRSAPERRITIRIPANVLAGARNISLFAE